MTRIRTGRVALAIAVLALAVAPARAAEPAEDETRETMRRIFSAFTQLASRADDAERFAAPEARAEVLAALRALRDGIGALEERSSSLNAAHSSAQRSLSDDVGGAIDAYTLERFEVARFRVGQLADNCFACHSKLPSHHRFDLGAELLSSEAVAHLPLERRAVVAVAGRQFEAALGLYEAFFRDPGQSAVQVALSGALEGYLKVALRVLDDRARAIRGLEAFRARPDLPLYLAHEFDTWLEPLHATPIAAASEDPLDSGRVWFREAQLRTAYPGDRRGLVHFVMASRELNRFVDARPADRTLLAEAFYLLGVCETHIGSSLWLTEGEDFLERAIRTAPDSLHARRAYATLEAVWVEGYTGSGGTHVPPDLARRLEYLRSLIEATTPAVSAAERSAR